MIRPLPIQAAQPLGDPQLRQILPMTVWMTLTPLQQTAVLQACVTMCHECLLKSQEESHDADPTFAENHLHPPGAQGSGLHSPIDSETGPEQHGEPTQSARPGGTRADVRVEPRTSARVPPGRADCVGSPCCSGPV